MRNRIFIISGIILVFLAGIIILNLRKPSGIVRGNRGDTVALGDLASLAKELEGQNKLVEARDKYQELINNYSGSGDIMTWQKKIEDLNIKLLFSAIVTDKTELYEVKPGDNLVKIARKFGTTVELIMKSNNLNGDKIFPKDKLKIWTAPFNILVDKSQNILMLKSGENIIKSYVVSTGLNNSTPVGAYKIDNKLMNPTWFKAGAVIPSDSPENVLGTRWLGFNLAGYGIHGTTEPENLGKQVTQGCVRMANNDVEELYSIVPNGTEVTIVD